MLKHGFNKIKKYIYILKGMKCSDLNTPLRDNNKKTPRNSLAAHDNDSCYSFSSINTIQKCTTPYYYIQSQMRVIYIKF